MEESYGIPAETVVYVLDRQTLKQALRNLALTGLAPEGKGCCNRIYGAWMDGYYELLTRPIFTVPKVVVRPTI